MKAATPPMVITTSGNFTEDIGGKAAKLAPTAPPIWLQYVWLAFNVVVILSVPYVSMAYNIDIVVIVLPLMILVEWLVLLASDRNKGAATYGTRDTWQSLTAGISSMTMGGIVFTNISRYGIFFLTYENIYYNYRVVDMDQFAWSTWILAFFIADLDYYIVHRLCHTISLLWAGHVIHHSSEHYNLSVAVRQSIWESIFISIPSLPYALFLPPNAFYFHVAFNTVYQFWLHTTLVRDLGWIEHVFNTPARHRVHHDVR
jgi:alkylglycerol monooxygenase